MIVLITVQCFLLLPYLFSHCYIHLERKNEIALNTTGINKLRSKGFEGVLSEIVIFLLHVAVNMELIEQCSGVKLIHDTFPIPITPTIPSTWPCSVRRASPRLSHSQDGRIFELFFHLQYPCWSCHLLGVSCHYQRQPFLKGTNSFLERPLILDCEEVEDIGFCPTTSTRHRVSCWKIAVFFMGQCLWKAAGLRLYKMPVEQPCHWPFPDLVYSPNFPTGLTASQCHYALYRSVGWTKGVCCISRGPWGHSRSHTNITLLSTMKGQTPNEDSMSRNKTSLLLMTWGIQI